MKDPHLERLRKWPEEKRQALAQRLVDLNQHEDQPEQLVAFLTGDAVAESSIRTHLADQLPAFMIPGRFILVDALPRTGNGKIDRNALTSLPTHHQSPVSKEPTKASNRFEIGMAEVWANVIGVKSVEVDDDFFELGGNSLLLIKLIGKIQENFGIKLPLASIGAAPTVRRLVSKIDADEMEVTWSSLVPLREEGDQIPFFMVHGLGGGVSDFYRLKPYLQNRPFYAIQAPLVPYENLPDMAAAYLEQIREVQPVGPYSLGGFCLGAVVAFEMARQLQEAGETITKLSLIESSPPRAPLRNASSIGRFVKQKAKHFLSRSPQDQMAFVRGKAGELAERMKRSVRSKDESEGKGFAIEAEDYFDLNAYPPAYRDIVRVHFRALRDYAPSSYLGSATIFMANDDHWTRQDPTLGWGDWIDGTLKTEEIAGTHHSTLQEPHVRILGEKLRASLEQS